MEMSYWTAKKRHSFHKMKYFFPLLKFVCTRLGPLVQMEQKTKWVAASLARCSNRKKSNSVHWCWWWVHGKESQWGVGVVGRRWMSNSFTSPSITLCVLTLLSAHRVWSFFFCTLHRKWDGKWWRCGFMWRAMLTFHQGLEWSLSQIQLLSFIQLQFSLAFSLNALSFSAFSTFPQKNQMTIATCSDRLESSIQLN